MTAPTKRKRRSGRDDPAPEDWASLAADLPDDQAGVLVAAREAVAAIDAAIMRGDASAAESASNRYEACVWKLNGGTHFGCMGSDDAAGYVIRDYCRATAGAMPLWGQCGEFLVIQDGMRVWVEYSEGMGSPLDAHFQFHAVDLDAPFISETGYRSAFSSACAGETVAEVARRVVAAIRGESKRPQMIEARERDALANEVLPAWLEGIEPPPRREPATLPPGYVRVSVDLPAHQAFIARKWATAAQGKIKTLRLNAMRKRERDGR